MILMIIPFVNDFNDNLFINDSNDNYIYRVIIMLFLE